MNLDLLTYPKELIPEGVSADLWVRYVKGMQAWDALCTQGQRCPGNPEGIRCLCLLPKNQICLIWGRVAEIASAIGGWTGEKVRGMD